MSRYDYFMVDADIVKNVINSNRGDYIKIAIGIFYETKKYPNINLEINDKNININGRVIAYEIHTTKHCNLIASDLFYHITQIIADPTIANVTITDTNMFETIKEDLKDDIKKVVDNYSAEDGDIGNEGPMSQQWTELPSFIPTDDQQLFVGRVCKLMEEYGDKLPTNHIGFNNLVYNCYINTGMQCLNACPEFVAWVKFLRTNPLSAAENEFIENLIHVIDVMRGNTILNSDNIKKIHEYITYRPDSSYSGYGFIIRVVDKLKRIRTTNNETTLSSIIFDLKDGEYSNLDFIDDDLTMDTILDQVVNSVNEIDETKNMSSPTCIIVFEIQDDSRNKTKINLDSMRARLIESVTLNIGEDGNECNYKYELVAMSMFNLSESGDNIHHIACAKHNDKWWQFKDTIVTSIDNFGSIDGTLFPSVLFYRLKYNCIPNTQNSYQQTITNVHNGHDVKAKQTIKDKNNGDGAVGNHLPGSPQSTQLPSFIPIEKSPDDKSTPLPSFTPTAQNSSEQTTTPNNTSISQEAQLQNDQSSQALFIGQVCQIMKHYDSDLRLIKSDKPIGLERNATDLQNTCYLNTGMQCLNACPVFVAWVLYLQNNSVYNEIVNNVIHLIKVMRGIEDIYYQNIKTLQTNLGLQSGNQDCSANFINLLINRFTEISTSIDAASIISNIVIVSLRKELESGLYMEGILDEILKIQSLKLSWIIMLNINDPKTKTNPIKLSELIHNNIESLELKIDQYTYKYDLVAMSMHSGTADSGHYIAYAKHNDKWWCFDDAKVEEIKIENGLLQSLINYTTTSNFVPSVFFYSLDYTNICPRLT